MQVSVAWVLTQTGLALQLRGGGAGVGRPVDLVLTTELLHPSRWLSGNELVLTTGIRLPKTAPGRAAYLRELDACGVAGLGFATGLTHAEVPDDLIEAADEIGLPLIEVPLETPFAAIVKAVSVRTAELQYDAVLRVSRAQPHITRAVLTGGAEAVAGELGRTLGATVLIVDTTGEVAACHPRLPDAALLEQLSTVVPSTADAGTKTVVVNGAPTTVSHQRIRVGSKSYGELVLISDHPLGHVDQILLGHANSLLALEFDKPTRLSSVQRQLNSSALGLLLNAEEDRQTARAELARVADAQRCIRALVIDCKSEATVTDVHRACADAIDDAGYECFVHAGATQLVAIVPGDADVEFAARLVAGLDGQTRRTVRAGLSGTHSLDDLAGAVANARLAVTMNQRGAAPTLFGASAGQALLSYDVSREVLRSVGDTMLAPLYAHDRDHHSGLTESLRAYLEANGHWETAAAAIGVHRHTLRNRIKTAQSLLGCDLHVARVRAELLLSLLAGDEMT
jgi:purine catabolism regulator